MKTIALGTCFGLIFVCTLHGQVTLIPFNDTWKYLDDGSNQKTLWHATAFNDASWSTGTGKFGYGISDANTIISFGPDPANKYPNTYFRKTINIANPAAYAFYEASLKRDDGAVVYVNGTEVYRTNMGTGVIYSSYKAAASATDNGTIGQVFSISSSLFVAGANTIAVEIHQFKITVAETDMAFDFSLKSPSVASPTLSSVSIASNNVAPSLAKVGDIISLGFTASEPVNTPTVTIATKTATVTAGSGNSFTATYSMVSGDASGVVPFAINFSSTAGTPGAQVTTTTNGSSVTFDKTIPTVLSINLQNPSSATTNAASVTFRVTFAEAVNSVDVPDFSLTTSGTVSGTVSTVTPLSGSVYDVTVASINGDGNLRLDLKGSGTGITDAAGNVADQGFTSGQAYTIDHSSSSQVTLIPFNDTWKYLDDGSNQKTLWHATAFNDASWPTGTGKFGYGISDANTIISFGPDPANKYANTYFRKTINIANPAAFAFYEASLKRDDGAVVYVNGTEVYRTNMGTGVIYSGYKAAASATDNGTIPQVFSISSSLFVAGANTIAVEIHQFKLTVAETDMAFDFSLKSPSVASPTLSSVSIASNNVAPSLAKVGDIISLGFTASEPVNTPTVTIATKTATVTAGSGNSFTATYSMVSGDAPGIVPFTINVTSTAGNPGAPVTTTTNGSSVTFDKTVPTVLSINRQVPSSATTNATSVTFRVTFSEAVNSVDVPDFSLTTSGTVTGAVSTSTPVSGSIYDVTVASINGDGTIRLDLKSSGTGIADAAGNAMIAGFTAGQAYTINQTVAPTLTSVSIASNNATPSLAKVGDIISLSFTASGPINTPTVTIATKTATVTAGSGNSFTATYTMVSGDAPGIVPFTINFSSTAGTPGAQVTTTTNGSSVTFDKTVPTVLSINRQVPLSATTNATSVTFRVTFSEAVNSVDVPDFLLTTSGTVTGAVSTSTPVSGSIYDVTVASINGDGTIRLDLKSSGTGIADAAGNAMIAGFTTGQAYTINQTVAPTLTSVSIASNNATPSLAKVGDIISLSFTASGPINTPTVTIATHPVTATVGGGNSFTATYSMLGGDVSGVVPFTINFSSTAGTPGAQVTTTTNGSSVTFDKTVPTVLSINRQVPSSATTNATSVTFRVTFSEAVNSVDVPDFSLTTSGTVTGVVSTSTPVSGSIYDVTVASINGDGTIRLDLKSSGTGIADAAGNAADQGFATGQVYTISHSVVPTPGFTSIIPLNPVDIKYQTKDKPQAKAWKYAGQWWSVLSAAVGGTKLFRLDGTSWTPILTLTSGGTKPDCWVTGDLVHLLLFNDNNSLLSSVKYDAATNTYKLWSTRPANVPIVFPAGTETATLVVDGNGRMWTATAGTTEVIVKWSDSPFSTWSAPISIALGVNDDDICALTVIPGQNKIGLFWSNQTTKRFGFRTHVDGTSPDIWTADEVPAAQSAINIGKGMADDHMNLVGASDGTLYCAVKTGYDKTPYPEGLLLVRHPSGNWDNAYTVTPEGTQAIVVLNESQGKVKVIYTTATGGGQIVYRESSTTNISFGSELPLMSGTLNYASSTHQTYNPEIVVFSTDETTTPFRAISVLASDSSSSLRVSSSPVAVKSEVIAVEENPETMLGAYPNPFNTATNLRFKVKESGYYTLIVYDGKGRELYTLEKGWAEAGQENIRYFNKASLASGLYMVTLKTSNTISTIKLLKN